MGTAQRILPLQVLLNHFGLFYVFSAVLAFNGLILDFFSTIGTFFFVGRRLLISDLLFFPYVVVESDPQYWNKENDKKPNDFVIASKFTF